MLTVMGLPIKVEWAKFTKGTSFFIPCLNRVIVANYILRRTERMKMDVLVKFVVENNTYGLRVWRV